MNLNILLEDDALFVVDTRYERIAILEANKLNIPVIALVDSNNSYEGVDYMIPANDDSMKSIELFIKSISEKKSNTAKKVIKTASKPTITNQYAAAKKSVKRKQIIKVEPKSDKTTASNRKKQKKVDNRLTEVKKK